ncbi:hypothetical protein ASD19_09995 [Microbacterium sp. Root53]|uniref:transglycosylase domain-containing protein n=1 Tax=Microbacterium sp. Root53 TaxID=1736553 RepID=UPI0006FD64DB|nr:transglycosylase domain-containing protein [Microbacterium sp. Root53]KQY96258.1 hypothetical protein ASD19_09995 [Microbacterium sp. Root53]
MPLAKRTASGVLGGVLGLVGLSAVAGVLVTATVTPAIAVSGYAASSAISLFDSLPSYLEVDQPMLPTTIYVDDPNSDEPYPLASFYDQNRVPVEYDEVSTIMYDAILSSEDPRYYEHGGVDLIGTTRALINNATSSSTQGGSSISQQYVKNVLIQQCEKDAQSDEEKQACFIEATQAKGTEGYARKLQEMRYAIAIEKEYSKNDILLGYLNIANFGGVTYGIEAAAEYYFDTTAKDLTIAQAATLAGIVQNPNYYRIDQPDREDNGEANGYAAAKDRRNYVLTRLFEDGKITEDEYKEAHASEVEPNIQPREQGCVAAGGSAYFCQYVKSIIENDPAFGETPEERRELLRRGGLSVHTTLDLRVQLPAEQAMRDYAPAHVEGMEFGATAVTLEADTGKVLAMAQNTRFSENPSVIESEPGYSSLVYASDRTHGGSNGFSVGSTFKVFTLLDWLEKDHSINEVLNGVNRTSFPGFNCDGNPIPQTSKIGNFNNVGGYTGTVQSFTRDSLNSGYLAMASRLNLCDIMRVADRLNVKTGDGQQISTIEGHPVPFDILGSFNIAPMAMASVYATIANNGMQCPPKAIEKVVDANGEEMPLPQSKCEQKLSPEVAATAASALSAVMNSGGTGTPARAADGVPVIGKTGTHEKWQTSMIQSSTKATTAVWVGNARGEVDVFRTWVNGWQMSQLRFQISRAVQGAANAAYPGGEFPPADPNLTRRILVTLPNVVGMSVADAERTLRAAGFGVSVGAPVPGSRPAGVVETQDPPSGRVASGTTVTISPSNGQGAQVPDVRGQAPSAAVAAIQGAGFANVSLGPCRDNDQAGAGRAIGTDPAAGTVTNRSTAVVVHYEAADCGGGGEGGGNGNGNGGGNGNDD